MRHSQVLDRINKVVKSCTHARQLPMARVYCLRLLCSKHPCKSCCNIQVLRHHLMDIIFEQNLALVSSIPSSDKKHSNLIRNMSRLGGG